MSIKSHENYENWLVTLLNTELVTVYFTKVDGSMREMRCTRNLNRIPTDHHPKSDGDSEVKSGVIRVFDIDVGAWRSFKSSSVLSIKCTLE